MKDAIEAVKALEQRRLSAMLAKDVPVLTRLLHDRLLYVHSTGQCMTKAEYLVHLSDVRLDYIAIEAIPDHETIGGDDTVVLVQKVAASMRVPLIVQPIELKLSVLTVWCISPDGWQLLSSISSPAGERSNG